MYKFKAIQTIPPAKQLVDIVLSKTNRKTPTVVHPGFKITRIRSFYMRKVKYCQTTYGEKFAKILDDFPKIDDIHPFYADLCNVLYDRDHYKLALGQVNATKKVVDNISKEYVKMMKFADSLYKCKMLKRAALGRMCTSVKKLSGTLSYLEEVRQHLGRLPSINPATRTLILTGYPNVGKSSFMNIVTNASVDVQPYAFTTKSLFVGHLDHDYVRWQVIDTPGILDHPLEDRNTIEMTAITALAHLTAAVLFFVDISEMCGYPLATQVALFHSIKPLFRNRPLLILLNKTDIRKLSELSEDERKLIESMGLDDNDGPKIEFFETSCATRAGVDAARSKACDLLLEKRVLAKVKQGKADAMKNRLHVVGSAAPANRPPCIPESVLRQRAGEDMAVDEGQREEKLERERMEELGGAGVYSTDVWRKALLEDDSWKYDVVPEIMDGKNIADFVDPDIEQRLEELEKEEALLMEEARLRNDEEVLSKYAETEKLLDEMHSRMRQKRLERRLNKNANHYPNMRKGRKKAAEVEKELNDKGLDGAKVRARSASRKKSVQSLLGKRKRDATAGGEEGSVGRAASAARVRSQSRLRGLPNEETAQAIEKNRRRKMRKLEKFGKKGEADHHIPDWKPKHLYSGKRGIGKTDRR
uniref:Nucleolar GTP-binding protein 1 n=1 Tax=Alexandrium monilatum TaxID=311494 RepID=A0A7S4SVG0_9DINO|mmetsp:Transcript_90426/g.269832  ORF Transcript_90426/g.269832 Transcript_90426/m.269832 type:complete len:644 (+) Transcript_90426:109-2040(+)